MIKVLVSTANIVVGISHVPDRFLADPAEGETPVSKVTITFSDGPTAYDVPDGTKVGMGDLCTIVNGSPTFAAQVKK